MYIYRCFSSHYAGHTAATLSLIIASGGVVIVIKNNKVIISKGMSFLLLFHFNKRKAVRVN